MANSHIRREPPKNFGRIIPPAEKRGSTEHDNPTFSLKYLQPDYDVSCCEKDDKAGFAETLQKLSLLTWHQINISPRHGLGCEKIARTSLRVAIPTSITDEVNFLAFRFSHDNKAMIGYRDEEMLYIVWLDRNFTVYKHE